MPINAAPDCPRCAYDLSGAIFTWKTQCPLEGTCPECGLHFEWSSILSKTHAAPRWSFEHTKSQLLRTWFRAAIRTARPKRFWSELRLEHVVVPNRLVLFVLFLLFSVHAFASCIGGIETYRAAIHARRRPTPPAYVWPVRPRQPYDFAAGALWPYGWPTEAIASSMHEWFIDIDLAPPANVLRQRHYPTSWLLLIGLIATLTPLSLSTAPDTLRGCRVRAAHVVRGWIYALPSVALAGIVMDIPLLLFYGDDFGIGGWLESYSKEPWSAYARMIAGAPYPITFLIWLVWFSRWWRGFIARYLRIPQPKTVTNATFIMGLLASVAIVAYFPGSRWLWDVGIILWRLGL